MKYLFGVVTLLIVTSVPFAVAGDKKAGGGGGRAAGAAKGGGGRGAGMHQGGGMRAGGGGMHQGGAGAHQGGMNAGKQMAGGQGKHGTKGFSTKSTNGNMAFHNRAGNAASLHSHLNGGAFKAQTFHAAKYSTVFQNYHRAIHERGWYVSHYNRVVLVGSGWYYWNDGYWYPAWGYDPSFMYVYDGPIYSYDNLPPDEVIVNVQSELDFQGYYHGQIDGRLGPETRAAIAEFQRDHELEVTSAVDEPTVNLLGLS